MPMLAFEDILGWASEWQRDYRRGTFMLRCRRQIRSCLTTAIASVLAIHRYQVSDFLH